MTKRLYIVEVLTSFRNSMAIEAETIEEAEKLAVSDCFDGFSQLHLGDQVFRSREVTEEEYLRTFTRDNDYLADIPVERKLSYICKS